MRFKEFKFAVIRSNFTECVSRKLVMMLTRDVYLSQDRWYLKCAVVGVHGGHIFLAGVERHECLFSNAMRDILNLRELKL